MCSKNKLDDEEKLNTSLDSINQYIDNVNSFIEDEKYVNNTDAVILKEIYEDFTEKIYKATPEYIRILNEVAELEKELDKTFTEEQHKLFRKFNVYTDRLMLETGLEAFIYGFVLAERKQEEVNKYSGKIISNHIEKLLNKNNVQTNKQ